MEVTLYEKCSLEAVLSMLLRGELQRFLHVGLLEVTLDVLWRDVSLEHRRSCSDEEGWKRGTVLSAWVVGY